WQREAVEDAPGRYSTAALHLAVASLAAFVAFRICQPYAFAGPSFFDVAPNPKWLSDLEAWRRIGSGAVDYPPSHQWTNRAAYLFPLQHMVLWGLGAPLGVTVWLGVGLALYEGFRHREWERHGLLLLWTLLNFGYWGGAFTKTMRYFLPIYPSLILLGSYLLVRWCRVGRDARSSDEHPALLEGGASAEMSQSARSRRAPSWFGRVGMGLTAVVVLATLAWATAFVQIYTRPVTRVAASTWICNTLPPGPAANEHWDDPLPLRVPGCRVEQYAGPQLELYAEDTPEKRAKLVHALDQARYIFVTSNRLYESIPRLPMRYPMTVEYYRLLFSEQLGFRLVRTFTSYPTLFGVEIPDDTAEEAFTVYDHPKVLIFEKTPEYSSQRAMELLGRVPLDDVLRLRPTQVPRNGLLLTESERAAQEVAGTWSEMFQLDSLANRFPSVVWWLTVQALGLAALPLTWRVFRRLSDRGYAFAKVLGILLPAYIVWLLASLRLLPNTRGTILLAVLVVVVASAVVTWRHRPTLLADLRRNLDVIMANEVVFGLAFLLFVAIRARNPDLWHANFGGEKPMDFAYLNAVVKSVYFPPYDPWLAGGYINYYYFGFMLVAVLVKLTGIVPHVAYNLAVPLLFALVANGAFAVAFNVVRGGRRYRWSRLLEPALWSGAAAALFVGVFGNLDGAVQVVGGLAAIGGGGAPPTAPVTLAASAFVGLARVLTGQATLPPFDFWRSTRVIGPEDPGPITEFPFFTFLYGDLHAHMMALPLATLALALGLNVVWSPAGGWRRFLAGGGGATALVAGLTLGALRVTNSWDFPTYTALFGLALLLAERRHAGRLDASVVMRAAVGLVATAALSHVLFLPFHQRYELFYVGVETVKAKTSLAHYAVIHGFFLAVVGTFLVLEARRAKGLLAGLLGLARGAGAPLRVALAPGRSLTGAESWWWTGWEGATLSAFVVGAFFLIAGLAVPSVVCLGLGLVALAVPANQRRPERLLVLGWIAVALAVTGIVEFFALKGDIGRMNTVFKFYLQSWMLLAIASAVAGADVVAVLRGARGWRSRKASGAREMGALALSTGAHPGVGVGWRGAWLAALGLLAAGCLVYPVLATPVKLGLRFIDLPPTLDGMAYMRYAVYHDRGRAIPLAPDHAAVSWMLQNIPGTPVVLEAQTGLYKWGSRVSVLTGLPTVIGWDWHQKQQRGDYAWMIDQRLRDVQAMFESPDATAIQPLLRKYHVRYIYVGPLERAYYSPAGLEKFERGVGTWLDVVYRNEQVTIYRVRER
ncbi:MAG TPA: DUF2298 domain-containing protein, partial [Chloroflexota bacterium]